MSRPLTARTLPWEWRNVEDWRRVDASQLAEPVRERFERLSAGIALYVETGHLTRAAKIAQVSRSVLIRQLNRCVTLADDGRLYGWAGLLHGMRTCDYRRKKSPPNRNDRNGHAGAFTQFLTEHPEIQDKLDALILGRRISGEVAEARVSAKTAWSRLCSWCFDAGVDQQSYPLNTKSQGRRSVARYVTQLVQRSPHGAVETRFGGNAAYKLRFGTARRPAIWAMAPFDTVQCDAHKIDCIGTLEITGPVGPQFVPIERLWLIAYLDSYSRCVLGYSVGITTQPSAQTIEAAFVAANVPWQPMEASILGIKYAQGAGFPSGLTPELAQCSPCVLNLDNAMQHYSHVIAEHLRRRLGCIIAYGGLADWGHNALLERWFKTLETRGFQRLPSTTGSQPGDTRARTPVRTASRLGITYQQLLYLADVLCANYNATPHRSLGGQSPLEVLRAFAQRELDAPLLPALPAPSWNSPALGVEIVMPVVRGSIRQGRRPYVEFGRARYSNENLQSAWHLIGERIVVHVPRDARTCDAYLSNGFALGELTILHSGWGRYAHTLEMRRKIQASDDVKVLDDDPIQGFSRTLATRVEKRSRKRPNKISHDATFLADLERESGVTVATTAAPKRSTQEPHIRPLTNRLKAVVWKGR